MIYNEMNLFTLLQTIQKLKAAVAILVNRDKDKLHEVQDLYFKNAMIYLDKEEEESF